MSRTESKNGYVLEPVLIFFLLTLLMCSWLCMLSSQKYLLTKAIRQSDFDLKVLEEAKEKTLELAWKKKCHLDPGEEMIQTVQIDGVSVNFINRDTCLESRYRQGDRIHSILLFYDEQGIVKVEYQ